MVLILFGGCWVCGVAAGAALGGEVRSTGARRRCDVGGIAVGITDGLYSWNLGVMGLIMIGTSVGGV